ncbi:Shikimate kinase [Bienertia sinuspersici]
MAASGTSTVFIDSVDASGRRKDTTYVPEVFIKAIEEVRAENVVHIVADNGPNFKAAGGGQFDVDVEICEIA